MTQRLLLSSFLLVFAAALANAQAQTNTLVLIPVFYAGPGAFGSYWNTQVTILNNSDKPVTSIPYIYPCAIPEGCPSAIPPHASLAFAAGGPNCPACFPFSTGYFESVSTDELRDLLITLRIYDQSQSKTDYGTIIPVAAAADFRETELQFLDVPANSNFRTTLRIYSLPDQLPSVRIRVYEEPPQPWGSPQPSSVLISESVVSLVPPPAGPSATLHGPSIQVNNPIPTHGTSDESRFRVTVQSLTAGAPIWALLTATNNQTQRVAAIPPQ